MSPVQKRFIATVEAELANWIPLLEVADVADHAKQYVDRYTAAIDLLKNAPQSFFKSYKHLTSADFIVEKAEDRLCKA